MTSPTPAAAAYNYESVTDDLGQIYVDVPTAWAERDTAPGTWEDGSQVPYIAAAPDLDGFLNGFDVPGLIFAKLPTTADVDAALAEYGFAGSCTDGGITDYSDPCSPASTRCGRTAAARPTTS